MSSQFISALILLISIVNIHSFKFPQDIERCPAGDTDCIVRVANDLIQNKGGKGNSAINLIPVDPMHIANIAIKQGAESPVNIELKFTDVDIIGMSNCKFTKINGFGANPAGKYLLVMKGPALHLVGPYKISGRVLVLPIQGVGQSNITLVDPELTMKFDGKDDNGHLAIENARLTFTVSRLYFDLENLYNGDKLLGESTNRFLNENWKDIFQEIKSNIFDAYTLIAENALRNVFKKVPYADLFAN